MKLILSDAAKSDMDAILQYTIVKWGLNQTLKYEQLLIDALLNIEKEPLFSLYSKNG